MTDSADLAVLARERIEHLRALAQAARRTWEPNWNHMMQASADHARAWSPSAALPILDLLSAELALHRPYSASDNDEDGVCTLCWKDITRPMREGHWPCARVRAIAAAVGVPEEEER